jgi:hypothetical protein
VDNLSYQVGRMMRWHGRAVTAVAALLILLLPFSTIMLVSESTATPADSPRSPNPPTLWALNLVAGLIGVVGCVVSCWLAVCWVAIGCRIFLVGRAAFGGRAGAGYAFLALIALPFCGATIGVLSIPLFGLAGIFAIPYMVLMDIKLLRDVAYESDDFTEPQIATPEGTVRVPVDRGTRPAQLVGQACIHCGERIPSELGSRFCQDCGSPVHDRCARPGGGVGCPTCGARGPIPVR